MPVLPAPAARRVLPRRLAAGAAVLVAAVMFFLASEAGAQSAPVEPVVATGANGVTAALQAPAPPTPPTVPTPGGAAASPTATDAGTDAAISVDLGGGGAAPSQSILIIIALTLLSVAPSLLLMTTGFTRIVIVLSLTRNALGVQSIPPNQVVVGLALFLSLFVMSPTLSKMNEVGLQPLLHGEKTSAQAFEDASEPLKDFMLKNTRKTELKVMIKASGEEMPADPSDVTLTTLIPAFVLSELKTAFIIGFVIFIPFLVIDLVVSSTLMALGMMMLPPVFVSLPFKILLFVMVDGWTLVAESLVKSFNT